MSKRLFGSGADAISFAFIVAVLVGVGMALSKCSSASTLAEYFIHTEPQQRAGMIVWADTRQPTSEWITYPNGNVRWLDPNIAGDVGDFERMTTRDGYLTLLGFGPIYDTVKWPADCVQAEIEDINSGARFPLTCRGGHYYSPVLVPRDPWRMRAWGTSGGRRFYWESDFYPGVQVFNPCWYEGGQAREAIAQDDAWFDEWGGWQRAEGSPPFDDYGRPIRPTVTKFYRVTLAKGAGVWTIEDKRLGRTRCAYSTWQWK